MATITQTSNANAVWNGTVPADPDPAVSDFVLYAAQNADIRSSYKRVKVVPNPGAGTATLGPVTYPDLFLITPTRKFFLRVTQIRGGKEDDLIAGSNPALEVAPSEVVGWSLGQLLEQGLRPVVVVGYDPTTNLYYPLNIAPDPGGEGFILKTTT